MSNLYGAYYSLPRPGGDLDAASDLYGPGSHAYLSQLTDYGTILTSYAYETDRGGIGEVGTTVLPSGYEASHATYRYGGDAYSIDRSVDTFRPSEPIGPGYGSTLYGSDGLETYVYASLQVVSSQDGNSILDDQRSFGSISYADGSSVSRYSVVTEDLTADGHTIPGSVDSYGVATYTDSTGVTVYRLT